MNYVELGDRMLNGYLVQCQRWKWTKKCFFFSTPPSLPLFLCPDMSEQLPRLVCTWDYCDPQRLHSWCFLYTELALGVWEFASPISVSGQALYFAETSDTSW